MKEKIDCKIIEDLLLPYLDGTLNSKSKEIVENHLLDCDNCKNKFEELKESLEENHKNDKKYINYLKKAKRKEIFKTLRTVALIIIIFILILYCRKFIIINNVFNQSSKYLSGNNIYIQVVQHLNNDSATIQKYYYKDGLSKQITADYYPDDTIHFSDPIYFSMSHEEFIKSVPLTIVRENKLSNKLAAPLLFSMHADKFYVSSSSDLVDGYVLKNTFSEGNGLFGKNSNHKILIDKKTGLPMIEINAGISASNYKDTNIWKSYTNTVIEYSYEFGAVTDEDVNQ